MRSRDSIDKKGKRRIIKQKKQEAGVGEAGGLAIGRLTSRTGAGTEFNLINHPTTSRGKTAGGFPYWSVGAIPQLKLPLDAHARISWGTNNEINGGGVNSQYWEEQEWH